MPPGALPTEGKAALTADTCGFLDQYKVSGHIKLMSVECMATMRRAPCKRGTPSPKAGGDPIINTGNCVAGWKKINGEWKIVWEIWTTEPLPRWSMIRQIAQ